MENTMPGDIDKINEIFRIHDEAANSKEEAEKKQTEEPKAKKKRGKKEALKELRSPVKAMDKLLTDDSGRSPATIPATKSRRETITRCARAMSTTPAAWAG